MNKHRKWMKRAIKEAQKCEGEDCRTHPKVGVVIVDRNGKFLAKAHRGECKAGEHGEYTILERKLKDKIVAGATLYTTLEPCTSRTHPKIPCAEHILLRKIRHVVIGMLDPNKEIRGRGDLILSNGGVEVSRFDHDLLNRLLDLNRSFIKSHERLGLEITFPRYEEKFPIGDHEIRGTFINEPGPNVFAVTRIGEEWWPQEELKVDHSKANEWTATVNFGISKPHDIFIVSVTEAGRPLVQNYFERREMRKTIIAQLISPPYNLSDSDAREIGSPTYWSIRENRLPKGWEQEALVKVNVSESVSTQ